MASEISIAVRGDQIQRGSRQRRAALSGYGEDFRRLRSARDDPTTALTIVKTGPRLKEDGVGRGRNALKDCREDVSEAHLFPGPDRVQQDASSNRLPGFADDASQREPSLVSTLVAEHTDVERVILRARPVSPLEEGCRSVRGNPVCGPVTAKQLRELLPVPTGLDGEVRRLPCEKLPEPRPRSRWSPARNTAGNERRSPVMTPDASRIHRPWEEPATLSGFPTRSHCSHWRRRSTLSESSGR